MQIKPVKKTQYKQKTEKQSICSRKYYEKDIIKQQYICHSHSNVNHSSTTATTYSADSLTKYNSAQNTIHNNKMTSDLQDNKQSKHAMFSPVYTVYNQISLVNILQRQNAKKEQNRSHENKRLKFKPKFIHLINVYRVVFVGKCQGQNLSASKQSLKKTFEFKLQFETFFQFFSKMKVLFQLHFWNREITDLYWIDVQVDKNSYIIRIPNLQSMIYLEMLENISNRGKFMKIKKNILEKINQINLFENFPCSKEKEVQQNVQYKWIPSKYPLLYYQRVHDNIQKIRKKMSSIWSQKLFCQILVLCRYALHQRYKLFQSDNNANSSQADRVINQIGLKDFKSTPSFICSKLIVYFVVGIGNEFRQLFFQKIKSFILQEFDQQLGGFTVLQYKDSSLIKDTFDLEDKLKENNILSQNGQKKKAIHFLLFNVPYSQEELKSLLKCLESFESLKQNSIHYEVQLLLPSRKTIQVIWDQNMKNQTNYGNSMEMLLLSLIQKLKHNSDKKFRQVNTTQKKNDQKGIKFVQNPHNLASSKRLSPLQIMAQTFKLINKDYKNLYNRFQANTIYKNSEQSSSYAHHKHKRNFIGNLHFQQINYKLKINYNYQDKQEIKSNLQLLLEQCRNAQDLEFIRAEQNLLWYFLESLDNINIEIENIENQEIQKIVFDSIDDIKWVRNKPDDDSGGMKAKMVDQKKKFL